MSPTMPKTWKRTRPRRPAALVVALASLGAGTAAGAIVAPAGVVHAKHVSTTSGAIAKRSTGAVRALEAWQNGHGPADYVRFVQARDAVADLIAADIGRVPATVRGELAQPSLAKQHAVLAALSQLGVAYRSMKSEPGVGFDCSGLTSWAYAQAGIEVPRVSGAQIKASVRLDRGDAEAGDLVHYPGHVGIYLGDGMYVHAPQTGRDVEVIELPDRSLNFGDVSGQ